MYMFVLIVSNIRRIGLQVHFHDCRIIPVRSNRHSRNHMLYSQAIYTYMYVVLCIRTQQQHAPFITR